MHDHRDLEPFSHKKQKKFREVFEMRKTEVLDWKEFMSGNYKKPTKLEIVVKHIEDNKAIYEVAGATIILFLISDTTAFASGIDEKASALYHGKLVKFGKWAIIIKGGWDTINKTIREDFDGAKRSFFSYLLTYIFLLGLPYAMTQVEDVFSS